jgi:branched-subunit amino acid transport protein
MQSLGVMVVAATVAILTRSMTWTVLAGILAVLVVDLTPLG